MNEYEVLLECQGCGNREIWYLNSEATLHSAIVLEINGLVLTNFNCSVCRASGADVLGFREAPETDDSDIDQVD